MNVSSIEPLSPRWIKSCTSAFKKGSGALVLPPYTVATPGILIMSKDKDRG